LIGGWQGFVIAIFVVPFIMAELGELTPKVLASKASDGFALFVALPAQWLTRVLAPLVTVLGFIPGILSRALFGVRLEAGTSVTEAELRMLIDISAEAGSVEEAEAELLDRVFHFGDRLVHEVMVPRNEAVWLPLESRIADFYDVFRQAPHSRFPVYEDNPDHVLGILGIKDVLSAQAEGALTPESPIAPLLRPAYFVPETKLIGDLFREMQASGTQMAVAVDEFGGTAGIVTLEALLEEMVGNVSDELRPAEAEFRTIDERTTQVDGGMSIEEAREELGIDLPEGAYDTVAGFVLEQLGHIPREGEQLAFDGYRITVSSMKGPKIESLRVTRT
jgi:putative hemolysin